MPDVRGPFEITPDDIAPLNVLFSDAFSDRYRRDGMVGVRVPPLNHDIWKFSIADAGGGAMLWRDEHGEIVAFNVAHRSGTEGWMGPLVVRSDAQGSGIGTRIVTAGIAWLRDAGARVIGLETMPRTVDNIGFYTTLGFLPGPLTLTVTIDAAEGVAHERLGCFADAERRVARAACQALTERVAPGYDFSREIDLTAALELGDTVVLRDAGVLRGFAICHVAPLVEGRAAEELRVLKVVLDDIAVAPSLVRLVAAYAYRASTRRAAMRVQGAYPSLLRTLVTNGARVRWTDLRMTLDGFPERVPARGLVLSNWEI